MKSRIGKIVIAAIFAIGMIIPMFSNVMAVNAADSDYQIVYYTATDAKGYLDGDKVTYPADVEGYLFAGWYKNEEHGDIQNAIVSSDDVPESGAYALYVPEGVLGIRAQLSGNLTDSESGNDETGAIRFVTSVDSLNYKDAGFFFSFEGSSKEVKRSNNKVSEKLFAIYEQGVDKTEKLEYTPAATFHACSNYFKTHAFVNIPKSQFDLKITTVPFWETLDGTIVRGNPVVKTINQGRYVHVKADGTDESGDGSIGKPYATLAYALDKVVDGGTIYIDGTYAVTTDFAWEAHEKTVKIIGDTLDFKAITPLVINDAVTFDNITLGFTNNQHVYANGYKVTVGEKTKFANGAYIRIYGGGNGTDVASTDLTVLAGDYSKINGAGNGGTVSGNTNLYVAGTVNATRDFSSGNACIINGASNNGNTIVNGSTNVYVGGDVNSNVNFSTSSGESAIIYGAAEYGTVKGDTNVIVEGNAKLTKIYGGGYQSTVEGSTHVTVQGNVNSGLSFGAAYSDSGRFATLYGGGRDDIVNGNTYVTVGEYASFDGIFGGARGLGNSTVNGVIKGETNVTVDGNVNAGASAAVSSHRHVAIVCGGGAYAGSTGNTNVSISGTPTLAYIYGAGYYADTKVKDTAVTLKASESATILSVYGGGSNGTVENAMVEMLSGTVTQIFGGCEYKGMTGNTDVRLLGGELTRRFAGGCYNGAGETSQFVTGYTAVTLGENAKISCKDSVLTNDGRYVGSLNVNNNNSEEHAVLFVTDYDNNTNRSNVTANTYKYLVKLPADVDASIVGNALQVTSSETVQIQSVMVENGSELVKNSDGTYQLPEYSDSVINIVISAQAWDGIYTVYNYDELKTALVDIESRNTTEEVVIKVAGNIEVPETVTINAGRNITLVDDGTVRTISRANGFTGSMFQMGAGATLTLKSTGTVNEPKLIIDGANVTTNSPAIYAAGSSNCNINVLEGVQFTNHKSTGNGSVIRLDNNAGATVKIDGAKFDHNNNVGYAATVYMRGTNTAEIKNSVFADNTSSGGSAIWSEGNVTLTIDTCSFENNIAQKVTPYTNWVDGTVYIYNNTQAATIKDSTFTGNTGDQNGGTIIVYLGKADVSGSTFTGNSGVKGAAILNGRSTLTVAGCTFNENTVTTQGGAICNEGTTAAPGTVTITNSTFTGNVAKNGDAFATSNLGGAISNTANCTMSVTDSTFTGNQAYRGGAIYNVGNLTLTGTDMTMAMFTDNKANNGAGLGGAIRLHAGTLAGSGYEFTNNSPDNISANSGATNNYTEYVTYVVTKYEEFTEVLKDIEERNITTKVKIILAGDVEISEVVTINADRNITIQDDGTVRTITRTVEGGSIFQMSTGATLTLKSTGTVNEPKLIVDGANVTTNSPAIYAAGSSNCNINVLEGVQFTNHKSTGNGSVIRLDNNAGATLKIDGAKFDYNNNAGYVGTVYMRGTNIAEVKNSVFEGNTGSGGSAIWSEGNVTLTIDTCTFKNNTAQKVTPYTNWVDGIVYIYNNTQAATIKDSTFTGNTGDQNGGTLIVYLGKADVSGSTFTGNSGVKGAAILNGRSTLTVAGCTFNENTVTTQGGAICNEGTTAAPGNVTITNSIFTGNVAKNGDAFATSNLGGAISNTANCTMSVTDSTFTGNQAYRGGAIYNVGNLTITGTDESALLKGNKASNWGGAVYTEGGTFNVDGYTFEENNATHGGAILMFTASTVKNSTFTGNYVTVDAGGAVYVNKEATFENCKFDSNTAINHGGAIYKDGNVKLTLTGNNENALFINNKAATTNTKKYGGAVYVSGGTYVVDGYTFEGNSASSGGALFTLSCTSEAIIRNCTFKSNLAQVSTGQQGGALYIYGHDATVENCKFDGNIATKEGGAIQIWAVGKTVNLIGTNPEMAIFENNQGKTGGAIQVDGGTLTGSGYTFTNNEPENVTVGASGTNNYQE